MHAGCQTWHQGYKLHWKNGMPLWPTHSEEGRSIPGAEPIGRISVLSSFNLSLFWTTQTFTSEMQDSTARARAIASDGESDLYSSVSSAHMWWDTEWWLIAPERGWVCEMKWIYALRHTYNIWYMISYSYVLIIDKFDLFPVKLLKSILIRGHCWRAGYCVDCRLYGFIICFVLI